VYFYIAKYSSSGLGAGGHKAFQSSVVQRTTAFQLLFYTQTEVDSASHCALISAIACSRVAEYPRLLIVGGYSLEVIVQNHVRPSGAWG
jgi:hypothetical protein